MNVFEATPISSIHAEWPDGGHAQFDTNNVEKMLLTTTDLGEPVVLMQRQDGTIATLNLSGARYWEMKPCGPNGESVTAGFHWFYAGGVDPAQEGADKTVVVINQPDMDDFQHTVDQILDQHERGDFLKEMIKRDARAVLPKTYRGRPIELVAPGTVVSSEGESVVVNDSTTVINDDIVYATRDGVLMLKRAMEADASV